MRGCDGSNQVPGTRPLPIIHRPWDRGINLCFIIGIIGKETETNPMHRTGKSS